MDIILQPDRKSQPLQRHIFPLYVLQLKTEICPTPLLKIELNCASSITWINIKYLLESYNKTQVNSHCCWNSISCFLFHTLSVDKLVLVRLNILQHKTMRENYQPFDIGQYFWSRHIWKFIEDFFVFTDSFIHKQRDILLQLWSGSTCRDTEISNQVTG